LQKMLWCIDRSIIGPFGWCITALAGVSRLAAEQPVRRKYS
jgi:hypothetical protein